MIEVPIKYDSLKKRMGITFPSSGDTHLLYSRVLIYSPCPANSIRYALMKPSILPSITPLLPEDVGYYKYWRLKVTKSWDSEDSFHIKRIEMYGIPEDFDPDAPTDEEE